MKAANTLPLITCIAVLVSSHNLPGQEKSGANTGERLFARDNLVAWCIVPFDAKKRSPEERVALLKQLGFRHYAYDWRAEHLPSFDRELRLLKENNIELDAVWFPGALDKDAQTVLALLRKHHIKTQLWVTMGDPAPQAKDTAEKVAAAVQILKPIAVEAGKIDCSVALYNHGGWFGESENQIAVIKALKMPHVGIVYNLHHGHEHLDRFPTLLKKMQPYLLGFNLNGMVRNGDQQGKKLFPLGAGDLDLALLRAIRDSGYTGRIGILGHTEDDVELRLRDNLDGLDWLVPQLNGKEAAPKPKYRTYSDGGAERGATGQGFLGDGKEEYRRPPLTVECRAKVRSKENYNILIASDTKQSGRHWEIFTMAGTGMLTVYMPGMQPDHVHSKAFLCDDEWHHVGMQFEPGRIRLYVDGKPVADQAVKSKDMNADTGGMAFGRLVEGGLGCDGLVDFVHIRQGTRAIATAAPKADETTLGLWLIGSTEAKEVPDQSKLKNPARRAGATPTGQGPIPTGGPNNFPADPRFKTVLIDRSADDAYLGVKLDTEGRIFVGAREAIYVFEPDRNGFYGLRQEICRFPPDSLILGLEWLGNDLYALTNKALYILPNGRIQREGVKPRRLLWGLPLDLHVSFHCLAWGPEGDLYLTHGDPLLNYGDFDRPDHWGHWTLYHRGAKSTTGDWGKTPYTGAGAVLRYSPTTGQVKVVATGLRGPVGLTFDANWNLFTNDNDHESRADLYAPCRLLHVVPHADFGWPRGWMASKSPERFDLLEPMTATLGRGVPCDLAYSDEPPVYSEYQDGLLMARWDRMSIYRYPLPRGGYTFQTAELPFLDGKNDARPVGVTVGRGGRVFATALYLSGNVWSPHCCSDLLVITASGDPASMPFEGYDPVTATEAKLWAELSSKSWERRYRAHLEILRRGGAMLDEATRRLALHDKVGMESFHLPWLAAASGSKDACNLLMDIPDGYMRGLRQQAVTALMEFPRLQAPPDPFVVSLKSIDRQVQLAALEYYFQGKEKIPLPAIAALGMSEDSYLRQAVCKVLARRAALEDLHSLAHLPDARIRLAAILAVGFRLTVPPSDYVPPPELPLAYSSPNASFKLTFADSAEPVDLKQLGRVGSFTTAQWWKAITPTAEQKALFDLLLHALSDESEPVQLQAAFFLSMLRDERSEKRIAQTKLATRSKALANVRALPITKVWFIGPFNGGVDGFDKVFPPEEGPIDLTAKYKQADGERAWSVAQARDDEFVFRNLPGRGSVYLYLRLQSAVRQSALLHVDGARQAKVWFNGRLCNDKPEGKKRTLALDVQPGSNEVLIRLRIDESPYYVSVKYQAKERLDAVLPEKTEPLKIARGKEEIGPEFLDVDWTKEARKGNAAEGRKLFATLSCAKCHAISPDQTGGGAPSLTDARKRFTVPHLVESIMLPSKQVAEQFRATLINLKNGQMLTGLVVSESEDALELLLPDASRRSLRKKDIEERRVTDASPMPSGLVKKPQELRDLLTYLLSDNPLPP
jgi:putative heme-binding domain-containing protein